METHHPERNLSYRNDWHPTHPGCRTERCRNMIVFFSEREGPFLLHVHPIGRLSVVVIIVILSKRLTVTVPDTIPFPRPRHGTVRHGRHVKSNKRESGICCLSPIDRIVPRRKRVKIDLLKRYNIKSAWARSKLIWL